MSLERRDMDNKRFKIDTTVNVAHILTTLGLVTAIFTWGSDVKSMLAKHDVEIAEIKQNNSHNNNLIQSRLDDLKIDIRALSEKVDYSMKWQPFPTYKENRNNR